MLPLHPHKYNRCHPKGCHPQRGDQRGGLGPTEREPRMCPLEQGRTSECIPGLSKNLGMYSRIERHGDRQTTGDWQFEEKMRLGRIFSSNCQSTMSCLSRGFWHLGLQMSNVGLRGSKEGSRGLPEGSAGSGGCSAGLGDCSEILEKLLRNSGPWIRNLDLGQAIWGLD